MNKRAARSALLGLLAAQNRLRRFRAKARAQLRFPPARCRTVRGPGTSAEIGVWCGALFGRAERELETLGRCYRKADQARFRAYQGVVRAFEQLGEGLRLEELVAASGRSGEAAEQKLDRALRWAEREGLLVDLRDRGWFTPENAPRR